MKNLKRFYKRNSHNYILKNLAGFGRAINRLYENRNHDVYSNGELTIIKKISTLTPSVIIDGGANIGSYSVLCQKYNPSTTIYSFEPVENTFKKLCKTVEKYNNIQPINKGLYKENCTKEINLYPSDTHSSIVNIQGSADQSTERIKIELIKGDDFMKENNIPKVDLLKIDVEGAEYDAILGFEEHIKSGSIKMIQFEYGYINISTKKLLIDFYTYFEKHDFIIGKVFPKKVEFRKYDFIYEDFIGPNFIAVRKDETELINLLTNK